ncbi:MAG TPA: YdcF family protein, partial [Chloroflexia bacterium]|nr:YdcF family protein [Chloroflexia bacterium]
LWGLGDLAFVTIGAETNYAVQADAIIVLGCNVYQANGPSPCIRARAGHAADLYHQGLATRVIATGGPTEQGPVESAVLARVLMERGVPSGDIIREEQALNTIQNIRNSQAIMREQGWSTAILVTEPFHINRAALIARDFGLTVYPSPAVDTPNWDQPAVRVFNISRDAVSLMLYQAKSLVGVRE